MVDKSLFEHCVRGVIRSAIPISLESSLDLEMGSVLVYEKTPTRFTPWRKNNLVFTGFSINDLLDIPVSITTDEAVMYDCANYSRTINDKAAADLDADVKSSLVDFGMNFNIGEEKKLSGNFGKVTRKRWNLRDEVIRGIFKATMNTDHGITKGAAKRGGTIFVVTDLYQADMVVLSLHNTVTIGGGVHVDVPLDNLVTIHGEMEVDKKKPGDPKSDPSGTNSTPSGTNTSTSQPTDEKQEPNVQGDVSSKADVKRFGPTYIAFHVLEFTFDAKGALTMKLGSNLSKVIVKYPEEVDFGGIGVRVAGHIKKDKRSPHTLGTDTDVLY